MIAMAEPPFVHDALYIIRQFSEQEKEQAKEDASWKAPSLESTAQQKADLFVRLTNAITEFNKAVHDLEKALMPAQKSAYEELRGLGYHNTDYVQGLGEMAREIPAFLGSLSGDQRELVDKADAALAQVQELLGERAQIDKGIVMTVPVSGECTKAHAEAVCAVLNEALQISGVADEKRDISFGVNNTTNAMPPDKIVFFCETGQFSDAAQLGCIRQNYSRRDKTRPAGFALLE